LSKKIEQRIESIVLPILNEMQIECAGVELLKHGKEQELYIYIDKSGGVTLDDCEKVSRAVDPLIEQDDPIDGSYILCVSSPGLDRPLKNRRDFERNIGKTVDVKLYKVFNGSKEFTGTLVSAGEKDITVQTNDDTQIIFELNEIALVRLHFDFK